MPPADALRHACGERGGKAAAVSLRRRLIHRGNIFSLMILDNEALMNYIYDRLHQVTCFLQHRKRENKEDINGTGTLDTGARYYVCA